MFVYLFLCLCFARAPCPDINYKSLQSDISGCANNFPYRIEHLLHSRLTRRVVLAPRAQVRAPARHYRRLRQQPPSE